MILEMKEIQEVILPGCTRLGQFLTIMHRGDAQAGNGTVTELSKEAGNRILAW